ncbi:hypothetical protein EYF80_012936 [Liparis tanakae]|uniref:GDP-mannose 4,6 dehydratase n=1 Tax=Liparis tanakae TaxID=230148 RepID=A0A4Z2II63_9TELE|nr:hypothetical protein EYF80_012936 [Liparis tanakae]
MFEPPDVTNHHENIHSGADVSGAESGSSHVSLTAVIQRRGASLRCGSLLSERRSYASAPDYLQGDSSKAYRQLGWKPKVTFEVRVTHLMSGDDAGSASLPGPGAQSGALKSLLSVRTFCTFRVRSERVQSLDPDLSGPDDSRPAQRPRLRIMTAEGLHKAPGSGHHDG